MALIKHIKHKYLNINFVLGRCGARFSCERCGKIYQYSRSFKRHLENCAANLRPFETFGTNLFNCHIRCHMKDGIVCTQVRILSILDKNCISKRSLCNSSLDQEASAGDAGGAGPFTSKPNDGQGAKPEGRRIIAILSIRN